MAVEERSSQNCRGKVLAGPYMESHIRAVEGMPSEGGIHLC